MEREAVLSVLSTGPTLRVAYEKPASGKPQGCRPVFHKCGPWVRLLRRSWLAETAPAGETCVNRNGRGTYTRARRFERIREQFLLRFVLVCIGHNYPFGSV